MPRISKDPEVRRNEILDVAMELFKIKGFEHTSVSDIVKKWALPKELFIITLIQKKKSSTQPASALYCRGLLM